MSRSHEKLGITMHTALAPADNSGRLSTTPPKRIWGMSSKGTHITAWALFCTSAEIAKPMATPTTAVAVSARNFKPIVVASTPPGDLEAISTASRRFQRSSKNHPIRATDQRAAREPKLGRLATTAGGSD